MEVILVTKHEYKTEVELHFELEFNSVIRTIKLPIKPEESNLWIVGNTYTLYLPEQINRGG